MLSAYGVVSMYVSYDRSGYMAPIDDFGERRERESRHKRTNTNKQSAEKKKCSRKVKEERNKRRSARFA